MFIIFLQNRLQNVANVSVATVCATNTCRFCNEEYCFEVLRCHGEKESHTQKNDIILVVKPYLTG